MSGGAGTCSPHSGACVRRAHVSRWPLNSPRVGMALEHPGLAGFEPGPYVKETYATARTSSSSLLLALPASELDRKPLGLEHGPSRENEPKFRHLFVTSKQKIQYLKCSKWKCLAGEETNACSGANCSHSSKVLPCAKCLTCDETVCLWGRGGITPLLPSPSGD